MNVAAIRDAIARIDRKIESQQRKLRELEDNAMHITWEVQSFTDPDAIADNASFMRSRAYPLRVLATAGEKLSELKRARADLARLLRR